MGGGASGGELVGFEGFALGGGKGRGMEERGLPAGFEGRRGHGG